jgi:hypothetical protein
MFLESMENIFDESIASCDFFDDPYAALDLINKTQKIDFFVSLVFYAREKDS